jgi:4-amino-4-deoxy-L-arabinose transferase-like glycosyltransferase
MVATNKNTAGVHQALSAAAVVLFWLVASALWFGSLSLRDLAGTDEGRYAEIGREMAQSGDYLTPRLNDLKYFEKPALQYWMTALAFKAFGESEFVARLWPGLCGFLSVLMVWYTARRLWGREVGLYTAMTTISMVWMIGVSHVITVDMSVSFFLTVAICGFLVAQQDDAPQSVRRPWMLLVWAAMAGAMLSKGLIGAVIPGAVLVFYSLVYRDWKTWPRMEPLWGPLLFLALSAPWFVLVSMKNPEFARFFFIHEHFERFTTTEHHRVGGWYYFVPILVGGLLPWATLLPAITRYAAKREADTTFQPNGVLLVWCVFIFVFFSFSGSKLPGYILPMFPALGLLLGRYLAAAPANALRPHALILMVLWTAGAIYAPFFGKTSSSHMPMEYNQLASWWILAAALAMVFAAGLSARAARLGDQAGSVLRLSLGGLLFGAIVMAGYQVYSPMVSAKNAAAAMAPYVKADTEVFSVAHYDQGLPFYLKRPVTLVAYVDEFDLGEKAEPQKWIPRIEDFAPRWNAAASAVALTSPETYEQLQKSALPMTLIYADPRRVIFRKP